MGEPYGIPDERREAIMAATERHGAISAELDKMRQLARLSASRGFETCEAAFAGRADVLEVEKEEAMDRLVGLCTDGSLDAAKVCRKAIKEITAGAER